MKNLIGFLLLLLLPALGVCCLLSCSNTADADIELNYVVISNADDSSVPESLRKAYFEDAARLALRKVNEAGGATREQVELPADLVQTLYSVLIHLYNAIGLAARDSVVAIYNIHTFPSPETHFLIVAVDSTAQWAAAWRQGNRLTGNVQIDLLMEEFNLELDGYCSTPWFPQSARLRSSKPLNIAALAKRFTGIAGIRWAEPDGVMGDGPDIRAQSKTTYWQLEYSIGWGDCPAGCIARHFWAFDVYYNGRVQYVGSWGDALHN